MASKLRVINTISVEEGGEERCLVKPVKVEGADERSSFVDPILAEQPQIIFDRVTPPTRSQFQESYGLSNEGPNPKKLKIGVHLEESNVESLFGPCINRSGYRYDRLEDEWLIRESEEKFMICHQRNVLPNNRLINKAEARGITYEKLKSKKVNWCAFAEWTCRNEMRRKDNDEAKDMLPGPKTGIPRDGFEEEGLRVSGRPRPSASFGDLTKTMPESSNRRVSADLRQSKSIEEWEDLIFGLESCLLSSEEVVRNLERKKEEAAMEKVRVVSQADFGAMMVNTAEAELRQLEGLVTKMETSMAELSAAEPLEANELSAESPSLGELKNQVLLQKKVIESLKMTKMSGLGIRDRTSILLQYERAIATWENGVRILRVWETQKLALQAQLQQLRLGFPRPGFFPAPLPFETLNPDTGLLSTTTIEVDDCPFCLRGFDPAWNCRIASCKHAYHSWCAWTHFSSSSCCCLESCGMEMHRDWWAQSGIPNPHQERDLDGPVWEDGQGQRSEGQHKNAGMVSRSLSTQSGQQLQPTRSRTVSPSVGSITFSHQARMGLSQRKVVPALFEEPPLEQEASPILGTLAQTGSHGKRKKGAKKSPSTAVPEVSEEAPTAGGAEFEDDKEQATGNSTSEEELEDDAGVDSPVNKRTRRGGKSTPQPKLPSGKKKGSTEKAKGSAEKGLKVPIQDRKSQAKVTRSAQRHPTK